MSKLSPAQVFAQVSAAVPPDCRPNIVIIGSLAAGYHFFGDRGSAFVRTKDVDCVLEPFHSAVAAGQGIARRLLDAGWRRRTAGAHGSPGDADTPEDQLPAIRLYPPGADHDSGDAWFVELLSVPNPAATGAREWTRLPLAEGHFGLPTFRFLGVATHGSTPVASLGIRCARPHLMALANLLEHPAIKPERMSALFAERAIKRSNKDLGRVLSIACLAGLDDYRPWAFDWRDALAACFPEAWRAMASRAGDGLAALLASPGDLDEAHHTAVNGLLASDPPTLGAFRAAGERLMGEAAGRLVELGEG